jgi:hypothetical protein
MFKDKEHDCVNSLKVVLKATQDLSIREVISRDFPSISQDVLEFIKEK